MPLHLSAEEVTLQWTAPDDERVVGYNIYYGTSENGWDEIIDGLPASQTSLVIDNLNAATQYYFSATSYDADANESDFATPISFKTAQPPDDDFFSTVTVNAPFTRNGSFITGTVSELPDQSEIMECGWKKNGLVVNKGNIVTVEAYAHFNNGTAPVSVAVIDPQTGGFISKERLLFLSGSGPISVKLPINSNCMNASLYVICGHMLGYYEFTNIAVSVITDSVNPVGNLYISDLVASGSGNICAAKIKWEESPSVDNYLIRVAGNRKAIEAPSVFALHDEITVPSGQTEYNVEIPPALYDGMHISVSALNTVGESAPQIISFLPGNILGRQDDSTPTLVPQIKVDRSDYYEAYYGYRYAWEVPDSPDGPACKEEIIDIDNNGLAGRYDDFYFIKSQYVNCKRLLLE
jgi:hypothetical protein